MVEEQANGTNDSDQEVFYEEEAPVKEEEVPPVKEEEDKPSETEEIKADEDKADLKFSKEDLELPTDIKIDDQEIERIVSDVAKRGLSKDAAQMIIDERAKLEVDVKARSEQALTEQVNKWRQETESDPDIGGDKLDVTLKQAKVFLDRFGSPELVKLLGEGYGNNKHVIKMLAKAGKAIGSDSYVPGKAAGKSRPDTEIFYS